MLSLISIAAGIAAGTLCLVQARQQPDKARQLRRFALIPFGMAGLMALLQFL